MAGMPLPAISHFSEEQSSELRDRIFDEFNTLAVILRAPSATFIKAASASIDEDEPDAPLVRAHGSGTRHMPVHRCALRCGAEAAVLIDLGCSCSQRKDSKSAYTAAGSEPSTLRLSVCVGVHQVASGPAAQAPAVDEGSALLSMDEQEEAFIDTSNGNSPGELARHQTQYLHPLMPAAQVPYKSHLSTSLSGEGFCLPGSGITPSCTLQRKGRRHQQRMLRHPRPSPRWTICWASAAPWRRQRLRLRGRLLSAWTRSRP